MDRIDSLDSGSRYGRTSEGKKKAEKGKRSSSIFGGYLKRQTESSDAVQRLGAFDEESDLEDLLDDVHQQGERLLDDPSLSAIDDYKKAVRNFIHMVLKEAVRVESVEGAKFNRFKPSNKQKRYTLINIIDDKLDKLAAGVLMNQGKQLNILAKIEEINGLLVDLTS